MAVDEAILTAVNDGRSGPTLRFYQWDSPTISLGYFQKYDEFKAQDPAIASLPIVRRQTGGGAILHDDELTYSLVIPLNSSLAVTDIEQLYQLVHDAFIKAMRKFNITIHYRGGHDHGNAQRGPFFCFSRNHRLDLVAPNDRKILGSAQRRIRNGCLQHGSLILNRHYCQQESAELSELCPPNFSLAKFIDHTAAAIAASQNLTLQPGSLSSHENDLAELILQNRYQSHSWTQQR